MSLWLKLQLLRLDSMACQIDDSESEDDSLLRRARMQRQMLEMTEASEEDGELGPVPVGLSLRQF